MYHWLIYGYIWYMGESIVTGEMENRILNNKLLTLTDNYYFKRAYNIGKSVIGKNCVIYYINNKLNYNRFGFTASKKIGSAVERNRAKRKIKEICRLNHYKLKQGYDIVIVIRARAIKTEYNYLLKEIIHHFNKLGLMIDN